MTDDTDKTAAEALSPDDREEAIDRLYDVALDPERYEALLDHWERAIGPLRAQADFGAPHVMEDPHIAAHFERASAILDRQESADEATALLNRFDGVPALLLNRTGTVCATNHTAQDTIGAKPGSTLAQLGLHADDLEIVQRSMEKVLSDKGTPDATMRVRAATQGRFTVLRLQKCHNSAGEALALMVSNEVGWPEGYEDILRAAFGLTAAETDVVQQLVACGSVAEIAETRSRSIATVRAQIKSVLSKTDTHSQVELVRLALSMLDMVRLTVATQPGLSTVSRGYETLEPRPFRWLTSADGRRVEYLVLGDPLGKPVIFWPLDYGLVRWPAPAEAEAARRGIKVIVPVRAGYGGSDPVARGTDYDAALLADTRQIALAEGAETCPMLTLGGDLFYATQYACAHEGAVTGIVACAGVLPMTRRVQFERMEKWHRFILAGAKYTPHLMPFMVKAGFLLARRIGKRGFIQAVYGKCPADMETFEEPHTLEAMVTGSDVALSDTHSAHSAFAAQLLGRQMQDWSADLEEIRGKVPLHFLNGLQDPQVPKETLAEFREAYDWIDYHVFEDAGQLIFFRHWPVALDFVTKYLR